VYDFKKGRLGKGSYGIVYKGTNIDTNQDVAIKLIKKHP
jgi:serine/threonine protein kinase